MDVFKLLILLFSSVVTAELVSEELFFYRTSRGQWHTNRDTTVLLVANHNNFTIQHGYADVVFEQMPDYSIILYNYTFTYNPDEKYMKFSTFSEKYPYNDCPLLGEKVVVTVIRVQHRNNQQGCASVETAYRYLQYLDSHLRLISADRVRMDLEKSVISNICCPCSEEECYGPDSHTNFINKVQEACKPLDPRIEQKTMTRIFLNDGFGGFAGLGTVGWIKSFANYGNYWAINNVNNDPDEQWEWEYNLSVIVHEFGHTMGMGHASAADTQTIGFLADYTSPDNYGDGGNVMGGGNNWDTIVGPTQYFNRFTAGKMEPFWFQLADSTIRKTIRILAWDHPYSRPFLGVNEPRFADGDLIDGIPYSDNVLSFEFLWTSTTMCSTVNPAIEFGTFYLEYRNKHGGQNAAGSRGVRPIQGRVQKSGFDTTRGIMLNANVDGLGTWTDSVIPAGVLWVPQQADVGTLGVRILKIHSVTNRMTEDLLDHPVQPLANIPYMEVEISYAPGIQYIPPLHPDPLPQYLTSPNLFHCENDPKSHTLTCTTFETSNNHFWFYMKPFAHRGHPRVHNDAKTQFWDSAAAAVVSLPKRARSAFTHFYGDYHRNVWNVNVKIEKGVGRGGSWFNSQLFRRKLSESDEQFVKQGEGTVFYCNGLKEAEGDNHRTVEIIDLFGYNATLRLEKDADGVVMLLPSHPLPGLYEGFLVKRGSDLTTFTYMQRMISVVTAMSEPRIAVSLVDSEQVALSSAGIPTGKFTLPSFYEKISLSANQWLPIMLADWTFDDYLLIDFEGSLPRSLLLTLDTDMGLFSVNLQRLATLESISLKLTYRQVINLGSVDGMIHQIAFNKAVTLLSVRVVIAANTGSILPTQSEGNDHFNVGEYRYRGVRTGFKGFEAWEYKAEFDGKSYKVNADMGDQYVIKMRDTAPLWWWQTVLLWIAALVGVAVLIMCCCGFMMCWKDRKKGTLPSGTSSSKQSRPNVPRKSSQPSIPPKPVSLQSSSASASASARGVPPSLPASKPKGKQPPPLPPPKRGEKEVNNDLDVNLSTHRPPPPPPTATATATNSNSNSSTTRPGSPKTKAPPPPPTATATNSNSKSSTMRPGSPKTKAPPPPTATATNSNSNSSTTTRPGSPKTKAPPPQPFSSTPSSSSSGRPGSPKAKAPTPSVKSSPLSAATVVGPPNKPMFANYSTSSTLPRPPANLGKSKTSSLPTPPGAFRKN